MYGTRVLILYLFVGSLQILILKSSKFFLAYKRFLQHKGFFSLLSSLPWDADDDFSTVPTSPADAVQQLSQSRQEIHWKLHAVPFVK